MLTILLAVVAVEAIAIALLLLAQVRYAVAERRYGRRRPLRRAARRAVVAAIASERATGAALAPLHRLRPSEQDDVLCGVASGVQSRQNPTLQHLASLLGTERRIERGLRSRRWGARLPALRRLTALGMPNPAARKLLADRNVRVRAAAADWAAVVAPGEATAEQLAHMLGESSDLVRHHTAAAIFGLGVAANKALRIALKSGDQIQRRAAIELVAVMADPVLAADAWPLIDDPDPVVRAGAIRAAAPILQVGHADIVRGLLRHPDGVVRSAAAEASGRARLICLAGPIAERIDEDPDARVREAAIVALGSLGATGELLLRSAARQHGAAA